MSLIKLEYKDISGFKYLIKIPEEYQDQPEYGIIIGPPDLSSLGLPENTSPKKSIMRAPPLLLLISEAFWISLTVILNWAFDLRTLVESYRWRAGI